MNMIGYRQQESDGHASLLACCRLLAMRIGEEDLAAGLAALPPQDPAGSARDLLAEISAVASRCGLRTRISRPVLERLFEPDTRLPLLAELHDRRNLLIESLHRNHQGLVTSLTAQIPGPEESVHRETIPREEFLNLWTGTLLRFERVNTALACFALVAREHTIDLTLFIKSPNEPDESPRRVSSGMFSILLSQFIKASLNNN